VWSLPVQTVAKVNGVPYNCPTNPFYGEKDLLILGTDAILLLGFLLVCVSFFDQAQLTTRHGPQIVETIVSL
jgi:hypothetical protein